FADREENRSAAQDDGGPLVALALPRLGLREQNWFAAVGRQSEEPIAPSGEYDVIVGVPCGPVNSRRKSRDGKRQATSNRNALETLAAREIDESNRLSIRRVERLLHAASGTACSGDLDRRSDELIETPPHEHPLPRCAANAHRPASIDDFLAVWRDAEIAI